jgi:hypothetical protein
MNMNDDLLMLRNGRMLILKDHEMVALQEEIRLIDGTRIALDGKVIMADGTFQALTEGQSILVEVHPRGLQRHGCVIHLSCTTGDCHFAKLPGTIRQDWCARRYACK